ncbi:MAG: DUF362 domain-containing protein [Verrucomicrobia bacterium]|nr:DUF362 domain-containing protein [Verrucomicrobiota bacterium]
MKQLFIRFICACQSLIALAAGAQSLRVDPRLARPDAAQSARVLVVQDSEAIQTFKPNAEVIRAMVNRAITNFTGTTQITDAWRSLVATQDIVGIKVFSAPGAICGTRPDVVAAVVQGLLQAGLPPKHIIVWDQYAVDLRLAGFFELGERFGIRVASSAAAGYDEKESYDTALLGHLIWGDLEFGKKGEGIGRKSFVSKLVTREMTKIINVTPLLNHNFAGVSGNLYGLAMGSVDNTVRFEQSGERLASAVPEIYALRALGDRVVLNIVDALICQYEGGQQMLLHYSSTLNELRFSKDPVALDVLSVQELERLRGGGKTAASTNAFELYQNASLLELGVSDPNRIRIERVP